MLLFCPTCANLLSIEEGEHCLRFVCHTCPYVFNIVRKVTSRIYPRLKEVDDVLGGSAAWENVDSTEERCPKCSHPRAYFMQIQTRSADEPMTTFYKCCNHERKINQIANCCGMFRFIKKPMTRIMPAVIRVTTDPKTAVRAAVANLRAGAVIAVPTDTIYGLAVSAQHSGAVKLLYDIKQRDESKPVAICVSKVSEVSVWGDTTHLPKRLLEALLPGPVTVVLKRSQSLNATLNPGNPLVGIRVPDHYFISDICAQFGKPIALTSANRSCEISSLAISEFQDLWPSLQTVFDGGQLPGSRSGSTVVDLSVENVYRILRHGSALNDTVCKLHEHGLKHENELSYY